MKSVLDYLQHTKQVGECWIWTRCLNTDGYPRAYINGNANGKVHRAVYGLIHFDEDITNKVIRHTCDNPKCINPHHLVSGSAADNVRDMDRRWRRAHTKLTQQEVQKIRELAGKVKGVELASMFNVDARTISSIINGRHFKWLPKES